MKLRAHRGIASLTVLCVALAACGSADDALVANPSFDRWCTGMSLCDWTMTEGVVKAHTWHEDDLAVSFELAGSEISQRIEHSSTPCYLFDTIADVDTLARLTLYIDFDDDGIAEFQQQLPEVGWKSVTYAYPAPEGYQSVRFIVRKEGAGRAVLAQFRVEGRGPCPGAALPAPLSGPPASRSRL